MADEELKKKRKIRGGHKGYVTTSLEKEPPLANQLKAYRIALTEKLNVLGALGDEILALMTESTSKMKSRKLETSENLFIK